MFRYLLIIVSIWVSCSCVLASGPYQTLNSVQLELLDSLVQQVELQELNGEHSENTRLVSSALSVLLGTFGAHRLYLGTTPKVAIIYGVTFGGFGILSVIDLMHLLFTKDLEKFRNNDRVFMWN